MLPDDKFNDLIQVLKRSSSEIGAKIVQEYRAAKMPRPNDWDDFWFSRPGYTTAAGVEVNEDTALKFSPVFAAVRKISETVATLPLHVYRETKKGKIRALDHPLHPILHHRPNSEQTRVQMWESLVSHLLLWGNCYGHLPQNLLGQVSAIWPLDPSRMKVKRPDPNGMLVYEYSLAENGQIVNFPPWEILHIAGLGFNGLMGYPVISLAREGIACGLAYEEYSSRFFSNNATPAGFLELPGIADAEERRKIKEDWYQTYGGVSNSQLIGIIGQGMKFNPVSVGARDAQFLESRKFQVSEIARWFNIPPHMIYDLERSTNNNIEQQSLEFVIYTIRPWLVRIEQAIQAKLIVEDNISVEHRVEGLLRGDTATRTAYYMAGRQWGWLSTNDIRELENMEKIEDGDEYLTPMNMQKIGASSANGKDLEAEKLLLEKAKEKKEKEAQVEA